MRATLLGSPRLRKRYEAPSGLEMQERREIANLLICSCLSSGDGQEISAEWCALMLCMVKIRSNLFGVQGRTASMSSPPESAAGRSYMEQIVDFKGNQRHD